MSWRKYQEEVAAFFTSLGYEASVEESIQGARANHEIDVLVKFRRHQFDCLWVVECKDWSTAVPKEKIAALAYIVADVGADKGIVISRSGFQSGAISAAQRTNILLTSLDELKESHEVELHEAYVDGLAEKLQDIKERLFEAFPSVVTRTNNGVYYSTGGMRMELMGRLGLLADGLRRLRNKNYPIPIDFSADGNLVSYVGNVDDFVAGMKKQLSILENAVFETETANQ